MSYTYLFYYKLAAVDDIDALRQLAVGRHLAALKVVDVAGLDTAVDVQAADTRSGGIENGVCELRCDEVTLGEHPLVGGSDYLSLCAAIPSVRESLVLGKAIGVVEHITVNDTYDVGGVLAGKGNGNVAARLSESPCVGQLLAGSLPVQ